jgi:TPR repeat protein
VPELFSTATDLESRKIRGQPCLDGPNLFFYNSPRLRMKSALRPEMPVRMKPSAPQGVTLGATVAIFLAMLSCAMADLPGEKPSPRELLDLTNYPDSMLERANQLTLTALDRVRKAAEQGDPLAQINVGLHYLKGIGVPKDPEEGIKWATLSAAQGNAAAENTLGCSYDIENGVAPDPVEAYKWYQLSIAQGDRQAARNLEILRTRLSAEEIDEGEKRVKAFVPNAPNRDVAH